ncbi:MAG: insulinase family protein [Pseudomonadales bacterium]|jgi:zinc protease|nr:insulinase family protein [Pseudomonadales bacterium]
MPFCLRFTAQSSFGGGLCSALLTLAACFSFSDAAQAQTPAPAPTAGAGYTLVERIDASAGELLIPYSKFVLDNGLTVIVHEDHSDPLVHVDVTYHVGSAREEARRSGFAHFFEHMMFQGSEHVGDNEHFKIVTEAGGTLNGTTNNDRTNYFETVPSNQLDTMLWLESDRMGFLLNAVTQQKFEIQRATVKNERGQNVDNQPYGRFGEVNNAALYPPSHPYSWPVIGYTEDLDAATVDDLKRFFLRWYGPNNATLTIGGDLNTGAVMNLVVKYFGAIPRGPEVNAATFAAPTLNADRYVSYVDSNIRFPALLFTWPTVRYDHPDRVALDALNEIIGVGRKSLLYKEFILTRKAIEASGFNNSLELGGALTFFVLPFPGTSLSDFETQLRAVIAGFGPASVSDEDIQIFKAQQEAALVNSLTSVRGKVSQLAFNQTFLGNPNDIQRELNAIRALTKDDVLRVFNTYIKGKPAVIQSVVPSADPQGQAKPDNYPIPARLSRDASREAEPLQLREVASTFDRTVKPAAGPSPLVTMPPYWQTTLAKGIEVIGTASDEVPLVNLRLVFDGGHLLETPAQYGLASLTAALMNEDTTTRSAEQFEIELQKLGSNIDVSARPESTVITMTSLRGNLDATLALLEERLFHSRFTQADLDRVRQQYIESLAADKEQPTSIANNVYNQLIYGDGHSFAVPVDGSAATLSTFTLDDVINFSNTALVAGALRVSVVGDVSQEEILGKLGFLQNLRDAKITRRTQPAAPTLPGLTLYLVDKPMAPQAEIRIGYLSPLTYDATGEYFERSLMNYILGGAFSSRINLNLREDKGYTYGARSGFSASKLPGPFTASASVRVDTTADAVRQFINEITGYRDNGITPQELKFTQDAIGQSEALNYETPGQKANLLQQIMTYQLPADFVRQQQNLITNLSTARVNALAKTHLPVERMIIVVVGDKASIGDSLATLGYPIVQLDVEGKPVTGN